ncbi:MAG TPA: D-hexose-6-phosphate mutarotase [bacterium]|nr:D-hexose-6-phosphate mutarotase [bacterium]
MTSVQTQEMRTFPGKGGLPMLEIENRAAKALISLYGGQVLSWQPLGEEQVLFISAKSWFEAGKAIRGGVPVCWPWFGPHPSGGGLPMHGFARLQEWRLQHVTSTQANETSAVLELEDSPATLALWPHPFQLRLQVDVGAHLRIALTMTNRDTEEVEITAALHSYFQLGEAELVHITGLDDTFYIDTLQQEHTTLQQGQIKIDREINRIYLETGSSCTIYDPALERQIVVKKEGSRSTVVWNPWQERSRAFQDLGGEEYKRFVCIEAGNVRQDRILLAPAASHTLATEFTVIH